MTEFPTSSTAVLERSDAAPLSPAELAAAHGLSVSGARPGLAEYVRQLWDRRHFIVAFSRA
ncbi:ABC transporter permease, partial [Streptomyces sp. NPDC050617]